MPSDRANTPVDQLLRYPDLVQRGIVNNRTTLNRWIRAGRFPAPLHLGPNTLAWREAEVEEFLNSCEKGS